MTDLNDELYKTRLADGTVLEPSIERPYDTRGVRIAEAALVATVIICGIAVIVAMAFQRDYL